MPSTAHPCAIAGVACVPARSAADRSGQVRSVLVPARLRRRSVTAVPKVGRRSFAGPISTSGAPCHALQGGVDGGGGVDRAYDLAEYAVCWRPRRGGGAKGAAEQADAADEGRLEASGSIMAGLFRGAAVISNHGKVVRPSQLIRSVRPTVGSPARGSRPGRGHGARCDSSGRSGCGAPSAGPDTRLHLVNVGWCVRVS